MKLADLDSLYLAALHSSTDLASHGWALGAAILGAPDMSIAKQTHGAQCGRIRPECSRFILKIIAT